MSSDNPNASTVNITVNGKPFAAKEGSSVIEAVRAAGAHVPHFCWHPGLSTAGVCRLCMVRIEGMPKLQISCNTPVKEGMKVDTVSPDVKEAQKWALEFHLVNHPLDCPICDQAGECKLQDYYMSVGRYDSQVAESKVLKPKALDVGTNLVLDTERCILCSRCVRFEDEITKTGSLGIFNRGDRSVIGLLPGKKITHNYSGNLADICPVGAFTTKDFRFKCRVWFLTESPSICPGCSTGCNVTLFRNKNERKYYRLKPRSNPTVNGEWMCDHGRKMYEHLNAEERCARPMVRGNEFPWATVGSELRQVLREASAENTAILLTPQYTNEEYEALFDALASELGRTPRIFIWRPSGEDVESFDGILFRGDRNPNSRGLAACLEKRGLTAETIQGDFSVLAAMKPALTWVLGPEIPSSYPDLEKELRHLGELPHVIYTGNCLSDAAKRFRLSLPTKTFAEKSGTYVNFNGHAQKLTANPTVFPGILGIDEILRALTASPK